MRLADRDYLKSKFRIWDKPPAFLLEFADNTPPHIIFKEIKGYRIIERTKTMFIIEQI